MARLESFICINSRSRVGTGHSLVQGLNRALRQTGEVRPELDASATVRTIIGQLAVYFLQQRFAHNGNEADDLKLIEGQIVRALRK